MDPLIHRSSSNNTYYNTTTHGWLNPCMQNRRYGGQTVKLHINFWMWDRSMCHPLTLELFKGQLYNDTGKCSWHNIWTEKSKKLDSPLKFEGTRKELSTVDTMILSQWNLCQPFNHESIRYCSCIILYPPCFLLTYYYSYRKLVDFLEIISTKHHSNYF